MSTTKTHYQDQLLLSGSQLVTAKKIGDSKGVKLKINLTSGLYTIITLAELWLGQICNDN